MWQQISLSGDDASSWVLRRMSVAQHGRLLSLPTDERDELMRWAQSRTLPAGDVFRARLILAVADGDRWREFETPLHTSSPTIAR